MFDFYRVTTKNGLVSTRRQPKNQEFISISIGWRLKMQYSFHRVTTLNAVDTWKLEAAECDCSVFSCSLAIIGGCHRGQSCQSHSSPRVMSRQSIPSIYTADHGDNWAMEVLHFGPSSCSKPLLAKLSTSAGVTLRIYVSFCLRYMRHDGHRNSQLDWETT